MNPQRNLEELRKTQTNDSLALRKPQHCSITTQSSKKKHVLCGHPKV